MCDRSQLPNRHERWKAKRQAVRRGDLIEIDRGYLHERNPNRGLSIDCYLCGTPHQALGIVVIRDKYGDTPVPLCESCVHAENASDRVLRKYWNAPDCQFGEAITKEQFRAVVEKLDATLH